ncbi:DNA alkylation response protein [Shewanella sp. OPT22]|nr:DNA alkylation response protein [Shewanella sp. OPT22]
MPQNTLSNEFLSTLNTHKVENQPRWNKFNLFKADKPLQFWLRKFDGNWAEDRLINLGKFYGDQGVEEGELANNYPPEFVSHDRNGHRIDTVSYHPSYHRLMDFAVSNQIPSLPWQENKQGAHVIRAVMEYLHMQADAGSGCPLTMTFAAVAALKHSPKIAQEWLPKITADRYDGEDKPYYEKQGVTIGMAMTEKQGGSDVRANTTYAEPISKAGNGEVYRIVGHKWFCSAPMSDGFLVLAQAERGLSCFLMPRWTPEGQKNHFQIQRLKSKLGNKSNASSEIEFRGASAWLIGEEGKGVRTIIDMVSLTRFDCMVGSSALMRSALFHALNFTSQRNAFGKKLIDQPLMKNVLADLALESEAVLALSMRVAHALDNRENESEKQFTRIVTAIGKYWICKRAPHFIYEAMESIGGIGYVESNFLPRLYREAPVNAIWEGSGNVQCLDLLRVMLKEPETIESMLKELSSQQGIYEKYDQFLDQTVRLLAVSENIEFRLRIIVDHLAKAIIASTLIKYGEAQVAEVYCEEKLFRNGESIGTFSSDKWVDYLIARSACQLIVS